MKAKLNAQADTIEVHAEDIERITYEATYTEKKWEVLTVCGATFTTDFLVAEEPKLHVPLDGIGEWHCLSCPKTDKCDLREILQQSIR